jgi:chorismate synthase
LNLKYGTEFYGYMSQLGNIEIPFQDLNEVEQNPFFAANAQIIPQLEAYMDELRKSGDSCGARIEVRARNVPIGLGEPLFDKLDADIAHAMMGINAVKGVEIGAGFKSVAQLGSEHGDELFPDGFASNNAGGTLGGISTAQDLRVSIAIKPTSSIHSPKHSIDIEGKPISVQTKGRHDPCVGIRATPIAEAMLALVLMDHALRHRAQCGDVALPVPPIPAARPGSKVD